MATADELRLIRTLVATYTQPGTLDEQRATMDDAPQPLSPGTKVTPIDVDGISGERIICPEIIDGRTVLFLHGGGYQLGSIRSHRRLAALVAESCRATGVTANYRLAPEHPFPAALEDAIRVWHWVRARTDGPVVIAGDSAGGGLALATLLALRDAGAVLPAAAILLAPWTDLTLSGASITECAADDVMLSEEGLRESARQYAGTRRLDDPLISPLFGDLSGLPPLLLQVGGADLLRDDSVRVAARARAAGVDVTLTVEPDLPHVFHVFSGILPDADISIGHIGAWLDDVLGAVARGNEKGNLDV
jgi:acetyl esterase/lipase